MKRKSIPFYPLLSSPELLSSDMQSSMFADIFAQIESESRFNPNHSKTDIHDPSARDAAISTIDNGIDATRQFVHSLLIRRNALVPFSNLPSEILAQVFHRLVLEELPLSVSGIRNLGWVRVTHVCRHWRQVALNDPSLWAKITGITTNAKWISEMLVRAKNEPLDIEFIAGASSISEAFLMILPHLSHTRQLRFHYQSTLHSDSIREIFSWEAPALERFELTVPPSSSITFPDLGGNMLFKGHAPRLRAFSLSRILVPWSLIPRGQLTWLQIAYTNEDVHSPGDLSELIDLLVNCPSLENLELHSCLPSQLTEFSHGRPIHLPNLSWLRLCGSTSRIVNMLKMLKSPSSTTIHLDCISETTHNDSEGLLLRVISAHFQSSAPVRFKSLTVRYDTTSSLYITASTIPFTLRNRRPQNFEVEIVRYPELVLSLNGLSTPGHLSDLLKQTCKMLPISNLESISMSADNIIDINWVELFSCCTNVTTMQAIGPGTSSFVRALTASMVTDAESGKDGRKQTHDSRGSNQVQQASSVAQAHAAIFPKLKFLGLTNLDFSENKLRLCIPFDVFERGLQQRMVESGAPLKFLRISHCDIGPENVNDLQKLVQELHWPKMRM